MKSMARSWAGALVLALGFVLFAAACGDDSQPTADSFVKPVDGAVGQDMKLKLDGPSIDAFVGPAFKIQGTIDIDTKMGCNAGDKNKDCMGTMIWGIWTKPATDPNPGEPIYISFVPDAKKGTTFVSGKIPIRPKMYLNLFIDDNGSATSKNAMPDKGDPISLDLDPFTAQDGQTITRNIVFWLRVP
jgi:hypothetical protein